MIPAVLTAPGARVLTSTRADALDVIAAHRSRWGNFYVLDSLGVGWPSLIT